MKTIELELYCPYDYKILTEKEKKRICNKCGTKKMSKFIPNKIWGLYIGEICNIHDYMYHVGKNNEDKKEADRVFLHNMLRLINNKTKWNWLKTLRKRRAYKYYLSVKYFGGPAFWKNKNNNNHLLKIT